MKITIEAEPEEVKRLLQTNQDSKEQSIAVDCERLSSMIHRYQSNSLRRSGETDIQINGKEIN